MSVKRFFGANNREAMARVRVALGDDALILANRRTDEGVEILALADGDAERLADAGDAPAGDELGERLLREMAGVRSLLGRRRERAGEAPRGALWRRLRAAGFSPALGESLLTALPEQPADHWLAEQLTARLRVAPAESLGEARVIALVGPTGVGKTTTAAKLAARHAMAHGPADVALVSTDNYRIGAHDQLRIYADLLGVDLHILEAGRCLGDLDATLHDKRLVIIDTVGLGQRDVRLAEQIGRLCGGPAVTPVLLLNAASQPETLDEVIANYRATADAVGVRLDDAIVTKEDEAPRPGPVLDALMRHRLRLHYVSSGQRVPEDLSAAHGAALIAAALAAPAAPARDGTAPRPHRLIDQGRALGGALATLRRKAPGFHRLEQVWSWQSLPAADQRRRVAGVDEQSRGPVAALCWQGGGDRPHAVCGLDGAGLPLADVFTRLPAGDLAGVLASGRERLGAGVHLLHRLPDAACWHWLANSGQLWASRARANNRVWQGGERRSLIECRALATAAGGASLRHRGRAVRVTLRRLPVAKRLPGGGGVSALLEAWFADLRDSGTGAPLARRYWLLPAGLDTDVAAALVIDQLRNEDLPGLAERAAALLPRRPGGAPGEAAGLLANGLAALACRLDGEDAEWALDVRAQLLNLAGVRRRRGARALLEALVTLFSTRDALREIGAPALVAAEL